MGGAAVSCEPNRSSIDPTDAVELPCEGGGRGTGAGAGATGTDAVCDGKSSSSSSSSSSYILIRVTLTTIPFCHVGTVCRSSTTSIHTGRAPFSRSEPGINADLKRKWYSPGNGNASLTCPKVGGIPPRCFGAKNTFG